MNDDYYEWYLLLVEARNIGLTVDDVQKWIEEQVQQKEIIWSMKQEA